MMRASYSVTVSEAKIRRVSPAKGTAEVEFGVSSPSKYTYYIRTSLCTSRGPLLPTSLIWAIKLISGCVGAGVVTDCTPYTPPASS